MGGIGEVEHKILDQIYALKDLVTEVITNQNIVISNLNPPTETGLAKESKQLADGHEVKLPTSQILTLTPPAAITGFATSAKQLADGHNVAVSNQITGFATSAKQLADGHNVAVSNMIPAVETGLATSAKQLADKHGVKIVDSVGNSQGVLMEDNCLTTRDYLIAVAEEEITSHKRFAKIGYTPTMTTTESEVWSKAGVYVFPAAGIQMQVSSDVAAGATADTGTVIKGNAEGTNQTVLCDVGGTATELNDVSVDFTAVTTVAIGDVVLVDPKGTTPEWGYVTSFTATKLTLAGGLSSGGTFATARAYTVVDASAFSGAHVVKIDYLTSAYAEKTILMCLNNTTQVTTKDSTGSNLTDLFRINSFRVIAAGSGNKATGNIWLESVAGTPRTGTVYSYITALFTRARNSVYTVPAGKTLFINKFSAGFSLVAGTKWEYARIYFRTNREPATQFLTNNIFYVDFELLVNNQTVILPLQLPKKILEKTDIRISGIASAAGVAVCSYRGWIETN